MFKIFQHNPILAPRADSPWQNLKVYNPAVLKHGPDYHMFYRAVGTDRVSRIGHALSSDGLTWQAQAAPVLEPANGLESAGVEDPRLIKLADEFYLTYTAYDGQTARLALAKSTDLQTWQRQGPILPEWDWQSHGGFLVGADPARFNPASDWSKVGAMFNQAINGKYYLLFGDSCIWLAESQDTITWTVASEPCLRPRSGFFDSYYLEMGPPAIKIPQGWLVFYHGVNHEMVYALGAILLDDNLRLVAQTEQALFSAQPSEMGSLVDINPEPGQSGPQPQVIFASSVLLEGDELKLYYGMADTCIGLARASLAELLPSLKNVL